jgi:D-arabinose 1-dehydrogenase-like Zn-dependent alcohol dehydrogenase
MAAFGTIYPLTISGDNLSIPHLPFLLKDLSIRGSTIASRAIFAQMLDCAVLHDIRPSIEMFPLTLEGVETAKARLEAGTLKYKGILEAKLD